MHTKQTCLWSESADDPVCGEEATTHVRVAGKTTKAKIPVCAKHKAVHDSNFAALRKTSRS